MYMCIFRKENGTHVLSSIPLKIKKKFFNMSKITSFNPVLQRDGQKNSHAVNYQTDINFYQPLS